MELTRVRFKRYIKYTRNILLLCVTLVVFLIYRGQTVLRSNFEQKLPKNLHKYVEFSEIHHRPMNVSEIRRHIHTFNEKQLVQNFDMYGPLREDTLILVVTVHKLTAYLKYLIISLSSSRGIEKTLIVFSHSYFDQNLNEFLKLIDFCRVMQIFYPYSLQTHPDQFPGFDHDDCSPSKALKTKCTGASSPDIRGGFRNPETSQKKHQWWWTANMVFESIPFLRNREGMVVFFEDDLYFIEDFVYMVKIMKNAAEDNECDMLSLGASRVVNDEKDSMYRLEVMTWDPRNHADVLAFDLRVWNNIAAHYDLFCNVDDDSWARSLFHLSLNKRIGKRFLVLSTVFPRAIKLSFQPIYILNVLRHDWIENVLLIRDRVKEYKDFAYPPQLEIYTYIELETEEYKMLDYAESRGGWADARDVTLCINMTVSKIKKVLVDIKSQFIDYGDYVDSGVIMAWEPSYQN